MDRGTKIILGILILTIIILVSFGAFYLTGTRASLTGRAGAGPEIYNLDKSYLFASPMTSKADGKEKIKVSAFLLSAEEKGVAGKRVNLVSQPPLTIAEIQTDTDSKGQAIFELTSNTPGRFILQASVEGNVFPQSVTVTFN